MVAALVVACILSCKLLGRREVGDEERYCVGDAVPLIRAAALGGVLVLSGDDREENRFLAEPVASEAKERMEDRPGTVFIGEEEGAGPPDPPIIVLYCRGELNILKEDLGDVGGVMPMDALSRRGLPPPETVFGEALADNAAKPFIVKGSVTLFPGEARGLCMAWPGYWACWTTVFIGEEMVL